MKTKSTKNIRINSLAMNPALQALAKQTSKVIAKKLVIGHAPMYRPLQQVAAK